METIKKPNVDESHQVQDKTSEGEDDSKLPFGGKLEDKATMKKRKNERLNAILYYLNVCMLKDARFLNYRPS